MGEIDWDEAATVPNFELFRKNGEGFNFAVVMLSTDLWLLITDEEGQEFDFPLTTEDVDKMEKIFASWLWWRTTPRDLEGVDRG